MPERWSRNPDKALSVIVGVLAMDERDEVIWVLAAGPLEHFLAHSGVEYIDIIEELARRSPRFNKLLGGVWKNSIKPEVWKRVEAARLEVW